MNITPYAICFFVGLLMGLYIGNLKFRKQVNEGLKSLGKKAAKINLSGENNKTK
jgi:hypothetical protein